MLLTDTLVVIGLATASLGTIQENGGVQEHTFWLRNDGHEVVTMQQGYTSCECTTIDFDKMAVLERGDSTRVILRFNPQGRGGEFNVSGTVVYGSHRKRVKMSMKGNCILSEETLMKRFPIDAGDNLRLSCDRFDLGIMHQGETKERTVVVLHRDENDSTEMLKVSFTVEADTPKGLQHIAYPVVSHGSHKERKLIITLDVLIQ